jgi:AbrB family looped-hinge helix DNA binding protein
VRGHHYKRIAGQKVKRMSAIATVSPKFRISIPKEVCDRLALRPGEKVAFIAKPEGYLIVQVPKREDLAGMARGANAEGYRDHISHELSGVTYVKKGPA